MLMAHRTPIRRAWLAVTLIVSSACVDLASSADTDSTSTSIVADTTSTVGAPTWHRDIAPIVAGHCTGCHQAGGAAPFALDEPSKAQRYAELMLAAIEEDRMPPWGARETSECTPPNPWLHDLRLDAEEKQRVAAWVAAGTPEGDPTMAPPPVEPVSMALSAPDGLFEAPAFTTSGDRDQYECLVIDPGLKQDVWVTGSQLIPGDARVVHHALIWVDPSGASEGRAGEDGHYPCFGGVGVAGAQLLWTWAPGQLPMQTPEGVGIKVPAGARLVLSTHYHPVRDEAVTDRSRYALRWTTTRPEYEAGIRLIGNAGTAAKGLLPGPGDRGSAPEFRIPAGASGHTESMKIPLDGKGYSGRIWAIGTHMHYLGTDMKVELEGDDRRCLLQTPAWDFAWQMVYRYDAPLEDLPRFEAGDMFQLRCTYDNTTRNPGVRAMLADLGVEEPVDVTLGEETRDEMCLALVGYILDRK